MKFLFPRLDTLAHFHDQSLLELTLTLNSSLGILSSLRAE